MYISSLLEAVRCQCERITTMIQSHISRLMTFINVGGAVGFRRFEIRETLKHKQFTDASG